MDGDLAQIITAVMVGGGPTGLRGMIDGICVISGSQILQCGAN
jgi:hypothetical protein